MFVLVVEDDRDVRELLRFTFERAGIGVLVEPDGYRNDRDDLVAVVSGLRSGSRLLRDLRRHGWRLPVIEVVKPFSPRELVARVRAHIPF
jgi:DNA-binding response OmpR family regulator